MKNVKNRFVLFFILFGLSFAFTHAHVGLSQPIGGEIFTIGSTMHIEWVEQIGHGESSWELYFSNDGGLNYSILALGIERTTLAYDWHIPQGTTTEQGRIKIIQNNVSGMDYNASSGNFTISAITSLKETDNYTLKNFTLDAAYPNPFNGTVIIPFELSEVSSVEINIYDVTGHIVKNLLQKKLPAGRNSISWNPHNLPSGVYFYTIHNGVAIETRRLLYIK